MKTIKKLLLATLMVALLTPLMRAQSASSKSKAEKNDALQEYKQPPQKTETVINVITGEKSGGYMTHHNKYNRRYDWYESDYDEDHSSNYTEEQLFENLFSTAKAKYGEQYPNFTLRNFKYKCEGNRDYYQVHSTEKTRYTYKFSATVVIPDPKEHANESLSKAIDKALRNVREGSRLAIDQVTVWDGVNREDYKDRIIDVLLDKGYKVVAREYLEKLYEEQKKQGSEIFNANTTVDENNFSAVGYFINVKVTETTLRVQVINVSTGEYEGNATINF